MPLSMIVSGTAKRLAAMTSISGEYLHKDCLEMWLYTLFLYFDVIALFIVGNSISVSHCIATI